MSEFGSACSAACGHCGQCTAADGLFACLDCGERRADEPETVCWVCCGQRRNDRQRGDDDGQEYGHPGDERADRLLEDL